MSKVDRQKLLANDAATIKLCVRFITGYMRRYISDPEIIADATQSAMVRLVARLEESGDVSSDEVMRELGNAANNALRRQLTKLRRKVTDFQSQLHTDTNAATEDYARYVDQRRELELIEQALVGFDTKYTAMFVDKVQGFTNEEIAARHGTTKDTVRGVTVRVRQKIRLQLTAEEKRTTRIALAKQARQDVQSPLRSDVDSSSE